MTLLRSPTTFLTHEINIPRCNGKGEGLMLHRPTSAPPKLRSNILALGPLAPDTLASGPWPQAPGPWPLASGFELLPLGPWPLASGLWPLASGF